MNTLDDLSALFAVQCIEGRGKLLALDMSRSDGYFGYPEFVSDDGWRIGVFCDCGEWDYIEWVVSPDGARFEHPSDSAPNPDSLLWHRPTEAVKESVYGWSRVAG